MKNKIIKLLSLILIVCAVCFSVVACTQPEKTVTLTDWVDGDETASYGETYQVQTVAVDVDGLTYPITSVTVKNSEGKTIELAYGKFVTTDTDGYTLEYVVKIGSQTFKKSVSLSVSAAAPIISLTELKATVCKDLPYALPVVTVLDYVDGEITEYSAELYKKTDLGEEKMDVDLTAGTITFMQTGEYYLQFSATNSKGITATNKTEITVVLSTPTLTLSNTEAVSFKNYEYKLPTCQVTDTVDGDVEEYSVEVYKADGIYYQKQDVDVTEGTFTPTETGTYLFLYSAINSHQVTATERSKLTVVNRSDYDEFYDLVGTEIVNVLKVEEDYDTEEIEERNDWEKINYNGKTEQTAYVEAGADEIKDFTGGYTGNAVRYNCTHGYSGAFRLNNSYSEIELVVLAEKYTHVSIWFAFNAVALDTADTSKPICYGTWGGLLNNAENGGLGNLRPENSGVWKQYLIKIDKFIELTLSKGGAYAELFLTDILQLDRTKSFIYVGDVSFEKIEPSILTVDKDTAAKIVRGGTPGTFVEAGADEIKDFAGGYTGACSKMVSAVGQNCFVKTSYTADEIRSLAVANGYTHVSMWMAVSATLNVGGASVYTKAVGSTWGSVKTVNTWTKYTVSIEDFIGQLSSGQVKLINFQTGSVNVYFGDIVFETIAE